MARIKKSSDSYTAYAKGGAKVKKMASGGKTSLGMKSVKAGFDNNPGVTRADVIVAAKGEARGGKKVKKAMGGTKAPVMKKGGKVAKKQAATAIAMKKAGKAPKKAMGGMKMGNCRGGCY